MNESKKDALSVLRVLGSAVPPEGMEARLVARLQAREAVARRGWVAGVCWAGAAAALVVAISFAALHGRPAKIEQVQVPVVRQQFEVAAIARPDVALPVRVRKRGVMRRARDAAPPGFVNAPPLPLTDQERLLLALAQRPELLPELRSIAKSETVKEYGVGANSIFELATQPLQPVRSAPLGDFE